MTGKELTINVNTGQTAFDNPAFDNPARHSGDGLGSFKGDPGSFKDLNQFSSNIKETAEGIKELLLPSSLPSPQKMVIISLAVVLGFIVFLILDSLDYSLGEFFDDISNLSLPTWLGGSGTTTGSGSGSTTINSINFKLNIIPLCDFTEYLSNTNDLINNGVTVYIKKKLSNTDLENIEDTCYSGKEIDKIFIKKTKDNETYVYIRVKKPESTTAGSGEAEGSAGTTETIDSKITQLLTKYRGLSQNTGHKSAKTDELIIKQTELEVAKRAADHEVIAAKRVQIQQLEYEISLMCECNDFNDIGEGEYELTGNFELTDRICIRKHNYSTSHPNLSQEWYTSTSERVIFTFEISDEDSSKLNTFYDDLSSNIPKIMIGPPYLLHGNCIKTMSTYSSTGDDYTYIYRKWDDNNSTKQLQIENFSNDIPTTLCDHMVHVFVEKNTSQHKIIYLKNDLKNGDEVISNQKDFIFQNMYYDNIDLDNSFYTVDDCSSSISNYSNKAYCVKYIRKDMCITDDTSDGIPTPDVCNNTDCNLPGCKRIANAFVVEEKNGDIRELSVSSGTTCDVLDAYRFDPSIYSGPICYQEATQSCIAPTDDLPGWHDTHCSFCEGNEGAECGHGGICDENGTCQFQCSNAENIGLSSYYCDTCTEQPFNCIPKVRRCPARYGNVYPTCKSVDEEKEFRNECERGFDLYCGPDPECESALDQAACEAIDSCSWNGSCIRPITIDELDQVIDNECSHKTRSSCLDGGINGSCFLEDNNDLFTCRTTSDPRCESLDQATCGTIDSCTWDETNTTCTTTKDPRCESELDQTICEGMNTCSWILNTGKHNPCKKGYKCSGGICGILEIPTATFESKDICFPISGIPMTGYEAAGLSMHSCTTTPVPECYSSNANKDQSSCEDSGSCIWDATNSTCSEINQESICNQQQDQASCLQAADNPGCTWNPRTTNETCVPQSTIYKNNTGASPIVQNVFTELFNRTQELKDNFDTTQGINYIRALMKPYVNVANIMKCSDAYGSDTWNSLYSAGALADLNEAIDTDTHKIRGPRSLRTSTRGPLNGDWEDQYCVFDYTVDDSDDSITGSPLRNTEHICSICRTNTSRASSTILGVGEETHLVSDNSLCTRIGCSGNGICNKDGSCRCSSSGTGVRYYGEECDDSKGCTNIIYHDNLRNELAIDGQYCDCSYNSNLDTDTDNFLGYPSGVNNYMHGPECLENDDKLCNGQKPIFGTSGFLENDQPGQIGLDLNFQDIEVINHLTDPELKNIYDHVGRTNPKIIEDAKGRFDPFKDQDYWKMVDTATSNEEKYEWEWCAHSGCSTAASNTLWDNLHDKEKIKWIAVAFASTSDSSHNASLFNSIFKNRQDYSSSSTAFTSLDEVNCDCTRSSNNLSYDNTIGNYAYFTDDGAQTTDDKIKRVNDGLKRWVHIGDSTGENNQIKYSGDGKTCEYTLTCNNGGTAYNKMYYGNTPSVYTGHCRGDNLKVHGQRTDGFSSQEECRAACRSQTNCIGHAWDTRECDNALLVCPGGVTGRSSRCYLHTADPISDPIPVSGKTWEKTNNTVVGSINGGSGTEGIVCETVPVATESKLYDGNGGEITTPEDYFLLDGRTDDDKPENKEEFKKAITERLAISNQEPLCDCSTAGISTDNRPFTGPSCDDNNGFGLENGGFLIDEYLYTYNIDLTDTALGSYYPTAPYTNQDEFNKYKNAKIPILSTVKCNSDYSPDDWDGDVNKYVNIDIDNKLLGYSNSNIEGSGHFCEYSSDSCKNTDTTLGHTNELQILPNGDYYCKCNDNSATDPTQGPYNCKKKCGGTTPNQGGNQKSDIRTTDDATFCKCHDGWMKHPGIQYLADEILGQNSLFIDTALFPDHDDEVFEWDNPTLINNLTNSDSPEYLGVLKRTLDDTPATGIKDKCIYECANNINPSNNNESYLDLAQGDWYTWHFTGTMNEALPDQWNKLANFMCCPTDQEQCSEQHAARGDPHYGNLTTEAIGNNPPIEGCGEQTFRTCLPGDF